MGRLVKYTLYPDIVRKGRNVYLRLDFNNDPHLRENDCYLYYSTDAMVITDDDVSRVREIDKQMKQQENKLGLKVEKNKILHGRGAWCVGPLDGQPHLMSDTETKSFEAPTGESTNWFWPFSTVDSKDTYDNMEKCYTVYKKIQA